MSQFAKQRLFQNEDRTKLFPEGHPEARFQYATPGDEIPDSACELYGLVDGDLPDFAADEEEVKNVDDSENKGDGTGDAAASAGDAAGEAGKAAAPGEDKAEAKAEDKAAGQSADKAAKPAANKAAK